MKTVLVIWYIVAGQTTPGIIQQGINVEISSSDECTSVAVDYLKHFKSVEMKIIKAACLPPNKVGNEV